MMEMTVLIVSHGRNHLLRRTLDSLADAIMPDEYSGAIIIENIKQDGVAEVVESSDRRIKARYLFEPSTSKSKALNAALSLLDNHFVVFLDDDVQISKHLLVRYAEAAKYFPYGAYFGGPTIADYDEPPPLWLLPFLPHSAKGLRIRQSNLDIVPDYFLGFNWAAFSRDLRALGGFNPNCGHGQVIPLGEESFLQQELINHGLVGRCVCDAVVSHYVPAERCSPGWAIRRAHALGITLGAFDAYTLLVKNSHGSPLLPLMRSLVRISRSIPYRDLILQFRAAQFILIYFLRYAQGYLKGFSYSVDLHPFERRKSI